MNEYTNKQVNERANEKWFKIWNLICVHVFANRWMMISNLFCVTTDVKLSLAVLLIINHKLTRFVEFA